MTKVTHPDLGQEVRTFGGYFIPREEGLLDYGKRHVFYIMGRAVIETSCCGSSAWMYVQVPGFARDEDGAAVRDPSGVAEVDPITEDEDRRNITSLLLQKHPGARVEIW